ncbi:MAG: hypothetical protein ACRD3E_11500 [Terriglobales bacterium]
MTDEEIQKLPKKMRDNIRIVNGEPMYVEQEHGRETYYPLDSEHARNMAAMYRVMERNYDVLRKLAQS